MVPRAVAERQARRRRWLTRRNQELAQLPPAARARRKHAERARLRAVVSFGAGYLRLTDRHRQLQAEGWTLTPEEEAQLEHLCPVCGQPPVWRPGRQRGRRRDSRHCGRPACWQQAHRNRRAGDRPAPRDPVEERALLIRAEVALQDREDGFIDAIEALARITGPTEKFRAASEARAAAELDEDGPPGADAVRGYCDPH